MASSLSDQLQVDRRAQPRVKVSRRVAIGPINETWLVSARTRDISLSGMRVQASLDASPGDDMVVVLTLEDRAIPALATVVRSRSVGGGVFEMGMQFTLLPSFSREKLAEQLHVGAGSASATVTAGLS